MTDQLVHEADARRYTLRESDAIVSVLEYAQHGGGVSFYHTVTVPNRRGEGHADRLVAFAVDDVAERDAGPITPSCWFVADWFDRHPERADLLG